MGKEFPSFSSINRERYNLPGKSTYYSQDLGKSMDMQELQWLYRAT
jgi:hypothetical protein